MKIIFILRLVAVRLLFRLFCIILALAFEWKKSRAKLSGERGLLDIVHNVVVSDFGIIEGREWDNSAEGLKDLNMFCDPLLCQNQIRYKKR